MINHFITALLWTFVILYVLSDRILWPFIQITIAALFADAANEMPAVALTSAAPAVEPPVKPTPRRRRSSTSKSAQ